MNKGSRFSLKQVLRVGLAGVFAATGTYAVYRITYQVSYSADTGNEFAGLSAAIAAGMLSSISYPIAAVVALWLLRAKNWLATGVASAATLYGVWQVVAPDLDWLGSATTAVLGAAVLSVVLLVLFAAVINVPPLRIAYRLVLVVVLGGCIIAGSYAVAVWQENDYNHRNQQASVDSVNFTLFLPQQLPAGTTLTSISLPNSSGTTTVPVVQLIFDGYIQEMYEFKATSSYNPPQHCGPMNADWGPRPVLARVKELSLKVALMFT